MKITNNLNVNTYAFQAKKKNLPKISDEKTPVNQELQPYSAQTLQGIYNVKPKKMNIEESKSKLLRQLNEVLDANKDYFATLGEIK